MPIVLSKSGALRRLRALGPLQIVLIAIAACVPLVLIGANSLVQREFEDNRRLRDAASRSYEARFALQQLLNLHLDIETADRGFVISDQRRFLQPLEGVEHQISQTFAQLDRLLQGQPEFAAVAARLHAESEAKRRFAGHTIRLMLAGRTAEARAYVATGEGKRIMDRFRLLIDRIDRLEAQHLKERVAAAERDRRMLSRTTIGLQSALILLLLIGAIVGLRINALRARAFERMRILSARQQAVFDSAGDGMLLLDYDGAITSLNPAAAHMFAYEPDEMEGQSVGMLYNEVPTQHQVSGFLRSVDASPGGARRAQEFEGRRKTGGIFPTEVAVSVVVAQREPTYLAVIRDITERKQIERMKTEFVSVVSHELRTPLTSIAGSLGLLAGGAAGALPERAGRLIAIAQSNSARLVRLINDILDIEKMEAGKMAFTIAPTPLAPLLEQCAQANGGFAADYGVRIVVAPIAPDLAVLADADRLFQVVTNLLSNAAKFSPKGGQVDVTVRPGERMHRISVADAGAGIPDSFRERIFQKFAQEDSSDTRQKGGTGLGLSIVAEIVSRLHGRVSFDSKAGEGTIFHVDLPAVPRPE